MAESASTQRESETNDLSEHEPCNNPQMIVEYTSPTPIVPDYAAMRSDPGLPVITQEEAENSPQAHNTSAKAKSRSVTDELMLACMEITSQ